MAYAVPVVFWADGYGLAVLLPLLTAPLAVSLGGTVWSHEDGEALNPALERTGQLLFVHSLAFAIGLAAPALV
jgi:1,4-dihydroxy-2-naphthoate octaprenyltransferase